MSHHSTQSRPRRNSLRQSWCQGLKLLGILIASAMSMGFMHGTNDAQKTMGIVALALAAGTASGRFDQLPGWLSFLQVAPPQAGESLTIAWWIKVMCALVMAAGTAAGGRRIIKTVGHKLVRLQPVNGFSAESSSAVIIGLASHYGIPVSTTQNVPPRSWESEPRSDSARCGGRSSSAWSGPGY
jgi:phosphate/sulfate permease